MTDQTGPVAIPAPPSGAARQWAGFFSLREMGVYYALIFLVIVLAITTTWLGRTNYLSMQNIANVLYQASLPSLVAVSMTVILVSGNFDLSVASVAALAAAILLGTADALGFGLALALAMAAAIAIGVINGAIVEFVGINAFIVTLGTLTAVRGLVMIYSDGRTIYASDEIAIEAMKAFESGGLDVGAAVLVLALALAGYGIFTLLADRSAGQGLRPQPAAMIGIGAALAAVALANGLQIVLAKPVVYMFVFAAAAWWVMNFTNLGRRLYAVGGNAEAARLSGINVRAYKLAAFALCSATAGFAGVLYASRLRSITPSALSGMELTVIAAAILGGTALFGGKGSVARSVAGALLLFTLTNGFNIANLGANYQGFVEGVVVIAAAAIYTIGGSRQGSRR